MATFYLDYEGGNDANDGTTFANRWKTITNGATAARIAPGDTIRIMASPGPTSIGNATWTGGGRVATVNISSSTNATPIQITTSAAHGLVAGDYVLVTAHTTNTNANGVWKVGTVGSSTTFTILEIDGTNTNGNGTGGATGVINKVSNCIVKTASPLVQNIALLGGLGDKPAWTASANVTTAQQTSAFKEGGACTSVSLGSSFTTGKAAYYTLPSTLNLSGYQQVSFWVYQSAGTIGAAGATYIGLCTDTLGATVVHQCPIPALGATGQWVPVTVDLGTNLNSAIRSVAFYVVTDNANQVFYLDNIIACKAASSADSISLTSLISKSDGTGDEAWYAVQSINYDTIMLANTNALSPNSSNIRGYNGTSETVTTYKRETTKTIPTGAATNAVQVTNEAGTDGNLITFSGGWDRTNMSTQTGETWYDGQNGYGYGILNNNAYNYFDKINFVRYNTGIRMNISNTSFGVFRATACGTGLDLLSGNSFLTATSVWVNNCATGITLNGFGHNITGIKSSENCTIGLSGVIHQCYIGSMLSGNAVLYSASMTSSENVTFGSLTSSNGANALRLTTNTYAIYINSGSTTGTIGSSVIDMGSGNQLYLNNFTINEAAEFAYGGVSVGVSYVYSNRHDNTDGNNWVFTTTGTINQQTSIVDSPATTSWKMSPTSTNARAITPLALKLGTVVCAASSLVTVTARMRRSNTGLTMRLVCPGGQISGVSSDVFSDMTAAADTWETVTITFTPTKPGGVDIYAYAFGGTTYSGYVCNLTASQA